MNTIINNPANNTSRRKNSNKSLNPNNPDTDTTKKLLTIQTRFERTKRIAQQLSLQRLQQKYPNNNNKITFTITTSLGILTAETFPFKESPVTIEYFLTLVEQ